jgi:hypothetical protein
MAMAVANDPEADLADEQYETRERMRRQRGGKNTQEQQGAHVRPPPKPLKKEGIVDYAYRLVIDYMTARRTGC